MLSLLLKHAVLHIKQATTNITVELTATSYTCLNSTTMHKPIPLYKRNPHYLNKRYHAETDSHIIHMLDFNPNAQADTLKKEKCSNLKVNSCLFICIDDSLLPLGS
jgi:nitrate/TMAO reductase-like tetraheme cytochrome c subunit